MILHVKGGNPARILREIRGIDPAQPVSETRLLREYASHAANFQLRVARDTLAPVAACALLLAVAGVAAAISRETVRRRRDIAIRIALGAGRRQILRAWLVTPVIVITIATAAGAMVGSASYRLLPGTPPDTFPAVWGALLLWIAAILSVVTPVWRASSTRPAEILKI